MLTVKDIMTTEVCTIRSSATVAQAIALMQTHQLRSLIVEREHAQGAYGIVTDRDIVYDVAANGLDPHAVSVAEIMGKPCVSLAPGLSLQAAARRFADHKLQRAPVIEAGALLGIVSLSDIVMKSDVSSVEVPDDLSQRIQTALQHRRLSWNEENQLQLECEAVWEVVEELKEEVSSAFLRP